MKPPFGLLLAAGLLVTACGAPQPAPNVVAANRGVTMDVRWRTQVGEEVDWHSRPMELGGVAISSDGQTVIATTSAGDVVGLNAPDGALRWQRSLSGGAQSTPAVAGTTAYVVAEDGRLLALDTWTGAVQWEYPLGTIAHGRPGVSEDLVCVISQDGTLTALDRATGELAWSYGRQLNTELVTRGEATPLIVDGSVFAGFSDGTVVRLNTEGRVQWEIPLADEGTRFADVEGRIGYDDGDIVVASFGGGVYRVNGDDGRVVWHQDLRGAISPHVDGDQVITTTSDGEVVWMDAATGVEEARLALEGGAAGEALVSAGYVWVPLSRSGVVVVDAATPWIHHRFAPGHGVEAVPVVHGSTLYVLSHGGYAYALSLAAR